MLKKYVLILVTLVTLAGVTTQAQAAFDSVAFKAEVNLFIDNGDVAGLQNFIRQAVQNNPGQEAAIAAAAVEANPRSSAIAISVTTSSADEATAEAVLNAAIKAANGDSSVVSTIRRSFEVTRPDIASRVLARVNTTSTPKTTQQATTVVPVVKTTGTPNASVETASAAKVGG